MPFADLDDINVHLPEDKLEVDEAQYAPLQLDAERIVRGTLAGFIPAATLATWTTPNATPGQVRAIAGRLVAAFQYRKRYSEDSLDDPEYAQNKYNEAMLMLVAITTGAMILDGVDISVTTGLGELDFFPNAAADGPKFTMNMNL